MKAHVGETLADASLNPIKVPADRVGVAWPALRISDQ